MHVPPGDGRWTIGRVDLCRFVVADPTVSRFHAALFRRGEDWVLEDLGSTNGTRVNGWRISRPTVVRPGDLLSIGAVSMTFQAEHRTQASTAAVAVA
jgi:pSer/pThr/pTyr-binding forkhead associated (FHA) protein